MKYVYVLGDGMADYPLDELKGKTPLEAARTPNLDRVARQGAGGRVKTVPAGFTPSSDVANLSLLSYNPREYYAGRGPLEAASQGVKLEEDEIAFRCNLVTSTAGKMVDYSAGHISSREGAVLINLLEEALGGQGIKFSPGVGYRHLLVVKDALLEEGRGKLKTTPPHDITGEEFKTYLPRGRGSRFLKELIQKSRLILEGQEINEIRIDLGENPANMIWPWGQGKAMHLPSFQEKFNQRGSLISAVDLLKGLATCIGFRVIEVPGATGYFDTDYAAKGRHALQALEEDDFVYVHIEAPDEAGHTANVVEKLKAIEAIDEKVLGPLLKARARFDALRIIVSPDHATPISVRTHVSDPVPFAVWGEGIEQDSMEAYSENEAKNGRFKLLEGYKLLPVIFKL